MTLLRRLAPHQRIALAYLLVASAWIFLSDSLLLALFATHLERLPALSMLKGIGFVGVTGLLLYLHLREEFAARLANERRLAEEVERVYTAQAALQASEARFRKAIEEAPMPVLMYADDGEILAVSRTWLELTGYHAEQLPTLDAWTELAYGARRASIKQGIDALFDRDRRVDEGNFSVTCADGAQRIWTFHSTPLGRLPDGRRVVTSMAADITERIRLDAELQMYVDIFRNTQTAIAIGLPSSPSLHRVNPAFATMHGRSVAELTDRPIASVFHPDDVAALMDAIRISHATGHHTFVARHIHSDGHSFPVLIDVSTIKDATGDVRYRVSTIVDISEQVRIQDELFRANQFLETLIHASPLGIIFFDPDGIVQLWNPAAEAILGWSAEEVIGHPVPYVQPDALAHFEQLRVRVAAGDTFTGLDVRRWRKDGTEIDLNISAGPLYDSQGRYLGVVGMIKDISERKANEAARLRAEVQLRQLAARLVTIQETERQAIARELHDEIGQTLTGLSLSLELFLRADAAHQAEEAPALQEIVHGLMRRVREISLDLRPAMLDDLGLLPALRWLLARFSERTAITVDFQHSGIERRFDRELETAIYRIIQESLTNVARHAGVSRASVDLWANGADLILQVDDRGRGFALDALEPLSTAGLLGMRERVQSLGGELTIDAATGRGVQIIARFPLRPASS